MVLRNKNAIFCAIVAFIEYLTGGSGNDPWPHRLQRKLYAIHIDIAIFDGHRITSDAFAAEDVIRQARRYKSRRELTGAIRRVARADLALRSNPPSKRLVLENLVLDLTSEPKLQEADWLQEQLPV